MKFSLSNAKVGDAVITSRPVGDTCPTSCHYLHNGCYAEQTEKLYPNTRKAGFENLITDRNKIRSMFIHAKTKGLDVRLHERGDFLKDGVLDTKLIHDIIWALEGIDPPNIWFYTHVYEKEILKLEKYGVAVYASVHNREQYRKAKKLGFKLFAFNDTNNKFTKHSRKGNRDAPKYIETWGEKFLVCPEQRLGRKKVTCCGTKDTTACNYCVTGKGHVLFINH